MCDSTVTGGYDIESNQVNKRVIMLVNPLLHSFRIMNVVLSKGNRNKYTEKNKWVNLTLLD